MSPTSPTTVNINTQSNPSLSATQAAPAQSEASKIFGLLYTLGIAAAAIFVKNPNHIQTATSIVNVLQAELPNIEGII
jgi:hypothetical protein